MCPMADSSVLYTVEHEAMATTFRLSLVGTDDAYLRQAARAACEELDRLESRLSRHIEHADVARLNRLAPGEALVVHPDTLQCLRMAETIRKDTAGAFDVSYGSDRVVPHPRLRIDPETHAVRILAAGVRLDLGGIGKGYALDRMAQLLTEWDITAALLCASGSTILAREARPGEKGWPIAFGPDPPQQARLRNMAFSGSGKGVRGAHIIDPNSGQPAEGALQAWAAAPTAAQADALSTAFMVMPQAAIAAYCHRRPDVSAWILLKANGPLIAVADRLAS